MPKLWTEIEGEPWLDNPRRRRRRRAGSRHRRRRKAKGAPVARRRTRRHRRRHPMMLMNPHRRRRHRRHFRRNPLFGKLSPRGIVGTVMDGLKGGVGVVAGKVVVRAVPGLIGQERTGVLGVAIQGLTAIVLAPLVGRFAGHDFSKAFLYGGFAAPIEGFLVKQNIPTISPALSSYPEELSALPHVRGALSAGPGAGMPGFTIDEEEEALVQ